MSESLTEKLTRHGMAAGSSHVYGGEADLLFAARDRILSLEAENTLLKKRLADAQKIIHRREPDADVYGANDSSGSSAGQS